jgi:hypothetical protein
MTKGSSGLSRLSVHPFARTSRRGPSRAFGARPLLSDRTGTVHGREIQPFGFFKVLSR